MTVVVSDNLGCPPHPSATRGGRSSSSMQVDATQRQRAPAFIHSIVELARDLLVSRGSNLTRPQTWPLKRPKGRFMYRIRAASMCFVVVLAFAPLPAHAQGPGSNVNARVAALEAAVAALQSGQTALDGRVGKLEGNITAADLAGSYAVYLIGISMDPPGSVATFNDMSSYVIRGTLTLTATTGTSGTGTLNGVGDGIEVTEHSPSENWTWAATPVGGFAQSTNLTWTYNSGTRTLSIDPDAGFNAFDLSVAVGGQLLVSAKGGTPSNNQQLLVVTRK